MKGLQAMLLADFYKLSHRAQYPQGTELVYSTWTPRASKLKDIKEVVVFGLQGFVQEVLVEFFHANFFSQVLEKIERDYVRVIRNTLGIERVDTSHIRELYCLGYLPLEIKALPEGTVAPLRVPTMTIQNTDPRFFWLTNFVETLLSCNLWQPSTSATIGLQYKKILDYWAMKTVGNTDFVPFQGHDFSMRGMSSLDSATRSGAGHLLSFVGTDTIPAITYLEAYYGADITKDLVGTSIPATEHSVMCAYGDDEASFKRLITEVYPHGFLSVVSDTWDLWDVIGRVLPSLKGDVMARNGKLVIRPDSGDPVKIVCGDPDAEAGTLERKGVVEALWDIFGGTETVPGYKVLDSHIGCIYGDSITLTRCEEICYYLEQKGFASINCVFGIGSYTYQYNTRDTFGYALKSTLCVVNGEERKIFKNPKTDDGTKKSARGKVAVVEMDGELTCVDGLGLHDEVEGDMLRTVFINGDVKNVQTLSDIRERIRR